MTEMLDVYDANRRHIGTADRKVVHTFGLWHKTVHCWLVWNGKLIFQRRAKNIDNGGKLYTTASGHVSAGETVSETFSREIEQEIGIKIINPKKLYEGIYIGDLKKTDGSMFCDRAFPNVFFAKYDGDIRDLKFNDGEVDSVVAIDLENFINFARNTSGQISAMEFDGINAFEVDISEQDFVLIGDETVYSKFGTIAEKIKMEM